MTPTRMAKLAGAAGVVGGATMVSRILGFVRDMVIAALFGAGMMADAFFVAFRIPSMLRELLGEGALSAAFVPTFAETIARRGRAEAWRLASAALGTLALLLVGVVALGVVAAPLVVRVIAPGFHWAPEKVGLTILLTRLMFPYIFFVGLAALFMGILNALDHFATPALSPIMLNLAIIGSALLLSPFLHPPVLALAVGVLVGGFGQLAIQVPVAFRRGLAFRPRVAPSDPGVRRIAALMAPGTVGLAITQVNLVVATQLASLLGEGIVSTLTYALRLVQLPIGVVGVAIGTAALPAMSASAAGRSYGEIRETLESALRLGLFFTLPAAVGLIAFRRPIVWVLFERGEFGRAATEATAQILLFFALGVCFYVANRILTPAYYSLQDTATPVKIGGVAVLANILFSLLLMGPLGAGGLALATALASLVNFSLLLARLAARVGGLNAGALARAAGRVALACLPLVAWAWLVEGGGMPAGPARPWDALRVGGAIAGGGIVFVSAARLAGCEELRWGMAALRRRWALPADVPS